MKFKKQLFQNIQNFPGWKTKRKIVVIESDDWGSTRMSSKDSFNDLLSKGIIVNKCAFNSNDALESNDDLEMLFDVLASVKDKNGNSAILTANTITANPDYEKIKSENFISFYYEPFTETLKKYPKHDKVYALYKEGILNKIFKPQFHGREHLNVYRWMKSLRNQDKFALLAFTKNMYSIHHEQVPYYTEEYMDAFGSEKSLDEQKNIITEGLQLFEKLFGFRAKSFIAPCYIWDTSLEETLFKEGVKYIQGLIVQKKPFGDYGNKRKKIYHYQGQKNKFGQRYLTRNVFFEPALNPKFNYLDDSLNRINIAFKWNKPAIICTHRLNFIGFINPVNRDNNLSQFKTLLNSIKKMWPNVEFMSTDQLGEVMDNVSLN